MNQTLEKNKFLLENKNLANKIWQYYNFYSSCFRIKLIESWCQTHFYAILSQWPHQKRKVKLSLILCLLCCWIIVCSHKIDFSVFTIGPIPSVFCCSYAPTLSLHLFPFRRGSLTLYLFWELTPPTKGSLPGAPSNIAVKKISTSLSLFVISVPRRSSAYADCPFFRPSPDTLLQLFLPLRCIFSFCFLDLSPQPTDVLGRS